MPVRLRARRALNASVAGWALAMACLAAACHEAVAPPEAPKTAVERLRLALDSIRRRNQLPALGAALVRLDSVPMIATVGVRRWGTADSVADADVWHLGSNTKAFAATHLAILVSRGLLRWDTRLHALYPELAESMRPEYRGVTIADVIAHRAGLIRDLNGYDQLTDGMAVRAQAMPQMLSATPVGPVGAFAYSNVSYMLVGSVIERLLGRSWEQAVQQDLLDPLELRSATLALRPVNGAGQPMGHQMLSAGPQPVAPEYYEVPAAMTSAGRMHISLADWSRFVLMHLRGDRGIDDVLPAALLVELHRPWHEPTEATRYNGGWFVFDDAWAGRVLQHGGTNGLNLSGAWLAPERGFAVLAVTNVGGQAAQRGVDEATAYLIAYQRAVIERRR